MWRLYCGLIFLWLCFFSKLTPLLSTVSILHTTAESWLVSNRSCGWCETLPIKLTVAFCILLLILPLAPLFPLSLLIKSVYFKNGILCHTFSQLLFFFGEQKRLKSEKTPSPGNYLGQPAARHHHHLTPNRSPPPGTWIHCFAGSFIKRLSLLYFSWYYFSFKTCHLTPSCTFKKNFPCGRCFLLLYQTVGFGVSHWQEKAGHTRTASVTIGWTGGPT